MASEHKHVGILLGYICIIVFVLAIIGLSFSVWAKPYNSINNPQKTILKAVIDTTKALVITEDAEHVFSESKQVDTMAINAVFLKRMREKGELLSSNEFAARITSYYNTLVAVLTALFVLFTLVTYLTIRSKFEAMFEDAARDLENKQRERIISELRSMLSDSKKIDEVISTAIGGHIDDSIATQEEVDDISESVESIGKSIASLTTTLEDVKARQSELYVVVTDLQDQVADGVRVVYVDDKDDGTQRKDEAAATSDGAAV